MFSGRLSCMHCKASFAMAFALKNHFDRGTCPVLLMNWVRDAQYGPKVTSDLPSTSHSVSIPLPTQGTHPTWSFGLMLGTDRPSIMTMRHQLHAFVDRHLPFHPERRLHWYTDVMRWTIHFTELPQVAIHMGPVPFIVRWIVEQLPVHWAWNSDNPDTWWDPRQINLDTALNSQVNWFCTAIIFGLAPRTTPLEPCLGTGVQWLANTPGQLHRRPRRTHCAFAPSYAGRKEM